MTTTVDRGPTSPTATILVSRTPDRVIDLTDTTATETVAIVGLGYVGLPTALAYAESGVNVIGVDISECRLERIRAGRVDLLAADLERLRAVSGTPRMTLTTDPVTIALADAVVICVPTPVDENLMPDLTMLAGACASVVAHARVGQTIVLTSTTYVGCTRDMLVGPLAKRGLVVGLDIYVAFSPERIDPGNVAHPQHAVPRVLGGVTAECADRASALLARTTGLVHRVWSAETAEMTKLFENTFRAVNIALVNEFSTSCRTLGLEVMQVIEAAATKPYGFMPFYPGPGVGGHCIPCDPHYLLWQLRALRVRMPIVEQSLAAIAERPTYVVSRLREVLADNGTALRGARVLLVGVAYKPGVEDVRESPALEILDRMRALEIDVAYWDTFVPAVRLSDGSVLASHTDPANGDFDLVLVHTMHPGADLDWIVDHPFVLDATYRLTAVAHRAVI